MLFVMIYYAPLQPIFHTVAIGLREWLLIIVASILPILLAGGIDGTQRIAQVKEFAR